jgi:polysaccharide deacetylase family protein (PEP-CTERM system associated)
VTITNVLSVDVEEYFHGMEFESAVLPDQRKTLPSRVEGNIDSVLTLLQEHNVHATFFTVGQIAEQHPNMLRRIVTEGHEIACHSYRHELVFRQNAEEFRADVRRAKIILEDLSGHEVIGYRAPNYSIGHAQQWAYDILVEEGFQYDSSIYPIRHDRYGQVGAPRFPYQIRSGEKCQLTEFPIGTLRLFGTNLPIGGGGYFRLFPVALTKYGIARVNEKEKRPVMFYFHPWELDPNQPRPPMPWHHRFRHYVGLTRERDKLSSLLRRFHFNSARKVLEGEWQRSVQ